MREKKLEAFKEEEGKRRLEHEKVKREKNERKALRLGEEEKLTLLRLGEEEKLTRDRQRFLKEDKLEHEQRMSQIREERDRLKRIKSLQLAIEEADEKKFDKKTFHERATSRDVVDRIEKLRAESDYNVKCAKEALNNEGFSNVNEAFDAEYIKSLYGGVVNNNDPKDSNGSVCVELNFGDEPVKHSNGKEAGDSGSKQSPRIASSTLEDVKEESKNQAQDAMDGIDGMDAMDDAPSFGKADPNADAHDRNYEDAGDLRESMMGKIIIRDD